VKKIFTIRDTSQQRTYLWNKHTVRDEVAVCVKRNIKETFLKYLPKAEQIIEAGCGLGAWVIFLTEHGYRIDGIDNNRAVVEELKAWNPGLSVQEGDILNLPYPAETLGAYISLGVVEHFENGCDAALREAYRLLKPGGLIFLTVPLINPFRRLIAHPLRALYLGFRTLKGHPRYFAEYRYTRREAEQLLIRNGFDLVYSDWDDFNEKDMSLGLWADFPQLHSSQLYRLNRPGRLAAWTMNSISRWTNAAGVFCLGKKPKSTK
jgi:SAM-dependent methyltransferase